MNRAFIIASFGDRAKQVQRLVKNIRSFVDYPIYIITTKDSSIGWSEIDKHHSYNVFIELVERIWPKDSYRADVQNSNFYKIQFALNSNYDSLCLLDDDMYIVNENFMDGFYIAQRFGAALPLNPRVYVKYNAMGAGVSQKDLREIADWPQYAPACNFSPFFVSLDCSEVINFLAILREELSYDLCRGTLAIWKASWITRFTPVYLPEQFCVCASNAMWIKNYTEQLKGEKINIPPMCLHLGHEEVREVFKEVIK